MGSSGVADMSTSWSCARRSSLRYFPTFWFSSGSITTSSSPRFLAPHAFRETMEGDIVYSN